MEQAVIDFEHASNDELLSALDEHRAHIVRFVHDHRAQLAGIQEQLAGHVARLVDELGSRTPSEPAESTDVGRLEAELAKCRQELQRLREPGPAGEGPQDEARVRQLEAECEELRDRVAETEQKLADAKASFGAADGEDSADLRRRLEISFEDVKEQRARCAELEGKLAASQAAAAAGLSDDGMDWESQKQRLLASLQDDYDEDDEDDRQERLTIEDAIDKTEGIVAAKDRQIAELEKLLAERSDDFSSVAAGAAAVADVLDKNEVVRQERENLKQLQDEWREKLRQTEIDISMERATLARDRAEMESKKKQLEAKLAKLEADNPSADDSKEPGGRWLARLGLKNDDE